MNFRDELQAAAETVSANPKVLAGVSAATTSMGVASAADIMSGALATLAVLSGIVATILLGRVHWISYKNHVIQNKIFRQQLRDMGGDPDKDE